MIIETIVSSVSAAGELNFAPMGFTPLSEKAGLMRLFKGSHTFDNLKGQGVGVINIVDDVLLFVETALYSARPPSLPATKVEAPLLKGATTCYEFKVTDFKDKKDPAAVSVEILACHNRRYFTGYCRASFAVLEATILATRLEFIDTTKIEAGLKYFAEVVKKTGGKGEKKAFDLVEKFIHHEISRLA